MKFLLSSLVLMAMTSTAFAAGNGKEIFERKCAKCHGAGGKGDGRHSDSLKTKPQDLTDKNKMSSITDEELKVSIQKGGAGVTKEKFGHTISTEMEGYPDLPEADVGDLIAYIRAFAK